jgi:aldose 1-epimerase
LDLTMTSPTSGRTSPTGTHHVISGRTRFGFATVTIAEVAAALRAFEVDGLDIVQRYPDDAPPSLGAGMVMAPWPNRIDAGRWNYESQTQQLAISEPKFNNALHGLLAYTPYAIESRTESSITLVATIFANPGYPFVVRTSARYSIGHDGLTVRHTATNIGAKPAPVAFGTHGYFKIGDVPTADLTLTCSAHTRYTTDSRLLPTGQEEVSGQFDLRAGRRVGEVDLDDCYTDQAIVDGHHHIVLAAHDGRQVEVWTDENFGHVVLLTTDQFISEVGQPTLAVAIEPQTAAADCLNNGIGLKWLEPGDSWSPEWGVTANL